MEAAHRAAATNGHRSREVAAFAPPYERGGASVIPATAVRTHTATRGDRPAGRSGLDAEKSVTATLPSCAVPPTEGPRGHERPLVGIVGRRDLLRAQVRPDTEIRTDVLRLVEGYTGDLGLWDVSVTDGMATIRWTRGLPQVSAKVGDRALRALTLSVGGVVGVRVLTESGEPRQVIDASA